MRQTGEGFMRKTILSIAAAFAIGFAVLAPAPAAAQTLEDARSLTTWATQYRQVVMTFVMPMQEIPQPPSAEMSRNERRAWANSARAWASAAQAQFAAARQGLAQLPPPPPLPSVRPEIVESISASRSRLEETLNAADEIAATYSRMADAVERNQFDQVNSLRVSSVDGALIMMRMFQDVNNMQADALLSGNPQRSLMRSYALSYEALWTLINFKRDLMIGRGDRAAAADSIAATAAQMRAVIVSGRSDVAVVQGQLRDPLLTGAYPPEQIALMQRVAATFDGSFDREAAMAGLLDQIVALLRDPRDIGVVEPVIDGHAESYANMDLERVADMERRAAIISGQ